MEAEKKGAPVMINRHGDSLVLVGSEGRPYLELRRQEAQNKDKTPLIVALDASKIYHVFDGTNEEYAIFDAILKSKGL